MVHVRGFGRYLNRRCVDEPPEPAREIDALRACAARDLYKVLPVSDALQCIHEQLCGLTFTLELTMDASRWNKPWVRVYEECAAGFGPRCKGVVFDGRRCSCGKPLCGCSQQCDTCNWWN